MSAQSARLASTLQHEGPQSATIAQWAGIKETWAVRCASRVQLTLNPRQTAANALRATQASIPLRVLTTHVSLAWLGPQVSLRDRANAPNVPVAGMLQVGVRSAPLARVALFRQRGAQIARLVRLVVLLRLRQQNVRCVPVASMLQAAIHNASVA